MTRSVYLLHFSRPFGHAKHYIGVVRTETVEERLERHRTGRGAKLCAAAVAAGIELTVARVWENVPFAFERKLKNQGGASRLCPICKEQS